MKYYIEENGLKIPVQIVKKRRIFDRNERLVVPVGGSGAKWVVLDRIKKEES